jgi:hypothetical protein
MPGKGVKPYETPDHQEGKHERKEDLLLFLVDFSLKLYVRGIGRNSNPPFLQNQRELTFEGITYMFSKIPKN